MSILDQYGNAISSRQFLKASQNGGGRTPAATIRALDPLRKLITYRDWLTTSYLSDKLYANFGVVEGMICQKSMFAIGNAWLPVFLGAASDWGVEARRWLIEEWYPTCDIRGMNYDFVTNLYQGSVAVDRAGDTIELLVTSENGWPMIQSIPARQIGQWEQYSRDDVVVDKGPYKGAIIRNGVIMSRSERPLAYRKLGVNHGEFTDLDADRVIHTFEPKWGDQSRGFPIFSSCIEDFRSIAQSESWEQQSMLIASAIGLIEYTEDGEMQVDEFGGAPQNDDGLSVESMDGGMVRRYKANSGQKLEQFQNMRPGDEWEKFQDRQIRKAAAAANWPYSWAWRPEQANGTAQRTENLKARTSVTDRQSLLEPRARRKIQFAISVAIKNGMLPPYPGADKGGFLKWGFTKPQRISIDEGRDRQQRREDSKAGLVLDSTIVEEDGNITYQDHCYKKAMDAAIRELARQKVEAEMQVKIDPREMKMFTPNDMAEVETPEDDEPKPEKE